MKTKHLPLSVALALGVTFVPAFSTRAATVIFTYDGTIDTWVVPDTGVYDITAFGAEGGYGLAYGGLGAEIFITHPQYRWTANPADGSLHCGRSCRRLK